METTIKINGKDITASFAKIDLNNLATTLKTVNPATKEWYTASQDIPASLLTVLTLTTNAAKTLEVTIAPSEKEAGKVVRLTFAQFVAKLNVSKKILDLVSKDTSWKYEVETVGSTTAKGASKDTVDYSKLDI